MIDIVKRKINMTDELRSKIEASGYVILDRRDGYEIKRK